MSRLILPGILGAKKSNYALQFDGVDDYVQINNVGNVFNFIQNTFVFTIKLRLRVRSLTSRNYILGNTTSTTAKGFLILLDTQLGDNSLVLFITNGGGANSRTIAISEDNVITDNEFHEVIVRCPSLGKNIEMLVDGVSKNVTYFDEQLEPELSSGNSTREQLYFSYDYFGTIPFDYSDMDLDYVEFYNTYNTDNSKTGLIAKYDLNEGEGCYVLDSQNNYNGSLRPNCPTDSPTWIKL